MTGLTPGWKKSSRSDGNTNCVEARWTKSSRSNSSTNCVEARTYSGRVVEFRDSKDPAGPVLSVPADDHLSFVSALKAGTFDRT